MSTLIYIAKAHLLFLVLGGIYHFVLRNEKSFTFNRFYLLAMYAVSIIAPLLEFKIFKNITIVNLNLFSIAEPATTINPTTQALESNLFSIEALLPWFYGGLIAISILVFAIRFIKSYYHFNLLQRFAKYDYRQNVYWVEEDIPPFTFMNKTMLPEKLKNEKYGEMIIKHEAVHRKTLHFFDIIWVEILSSFLIFNPLNRKMKKYVVENHEYLADKQACDATQKSSYTEVLVQQALNQNNLSFVSFFAKPMILNRLNMLNSNKNSKVKPILMSFCFLFFTFLFSCDFNSTEEIIIKEENKDIADNSTLESGDVNENTVFSIVETQAEPKDGIQSLYNYISKELEDKYPQSAIDKGVEGVVFVEFTIEIDGSLSNVQAVKGIGAGCDELAVEVLKNHNNWVPGKQKGKKVRSKRVIPIRFVL